MERLKDREYGMKNTFKFFGIIAFAAIIIFSMTSCIMTEGGSLKVINGSATDSYYIRIFMTNVPHNQATIDSLSVLSGDWIGQLAPYEPGGFANTSNDKDWNYVVYWGEYLTMASLTRIEGRISGFENKTITIPPP